MPGMRTSMITTAGRRRSTSATALSPSAASPTMRMCGARESESRRPSRTTSWSSTISVVISSGMCAAIVCAAAASARAQSGISVSCSGDGGGASRTRRRSRMPCARASSPHLSPHRRGLGVRQVGARGRGARTPAGARASRGRGRRGSARACPGFRWRTFAQTPHAPASRAARTTSASCSGESEMPGQDRRHADRRPARRRPTSARRAPAAAGAAAPCRARCAARPPRRASARRTSTETSARVAASTSTSTSRTISGPRVISENGFAASRERLDAGARQPVAPLGRLVRIGGGADRDAARRCHDAARELAPQHLGDVDLDADRRAVARRPRAGRPAARRRGRNRTCSGATQPMYGLSDQPNGMPLHPVERGLARLLAVLRPHRGEHRTYVRLERRPRRAARLRYDSGRLDDDLPPSTCAPATAHAA